MQKEKTSRTKIQKKETNLFSSIFSNEKKKTIFLSSIGAIVIIAVSLSLNVSISGVSVSTFGIVGGLIVGVVPYAMLNLKQVRRRDSIDRNLPIFLLALISAVQ
ncbi:MAG: hypothetical protein KGL95_10235, partial [Patescibacteria group bacterium]|nr:hypothetical protein [Patescibacteria group bacterium]